jgi:hypothetical protein
MLVEFSYASFTKNRCLFWSLQHSLPHAGHSLFIGKGAQSLVARALKEVTRLDRRWF